MRRDHWESPDLPDLQGYLETRADLARVVRRDPPDLRARKVDPVSRDLLGYLDFLVSGDFPASLGCLD